ncbi:MAG: glycine zipper domain-containing protein [Verrucomicrobiota bacterium]
MKSFFRVFCLSILTVVFASCTPGERGAVVGGAIGAGTGALIGDGTGALIGGAIGAVAGSEISKKRARRNRYYYEDEYGYGPPSGPPPGYGY